MAHNCLDWTASPPSRKTPLLILTFGDDRVYTTIPNEFKTLEEVTRREFGLANGELKFSSSCVNLCNGLPARITGHVWEHISPYIGCASVEVVGPSNHDPDTNLRTASETLHGDLGVKENLFFEARDDGRPKVEHHSSGKQDSPRKEPTRQDPTPDHEHDDQAEFYGPPPEEPEEEEANSKPLSRSRLRRRVVSEDEDAGDDSEREVPTNPFPPPAVSPPKQVKTKKDDSPQSSLADLLSQGTPTFSNQSIKQEKQESRCERNSHGSRTTSQSQHEDQGAATVESSDGRKLMIRVAHRASKQESKFTTKSSTKVAKVISAACKSFGLDASQVTLYLIVSVDGEDDIEESLFPCDKNDTIARAGAEQDTETKFLLKIAGEV